MDPTCTEEIEVVDPGPTATIRLVVIGLIGAAAFLVVMAGWATLDRLGSGGWVGSAEAAVGGVKQTAQGEAQGEIFDFGFNVPTGVTVGDSVTFQNNGGRPHTVSDRGGIFDTGAVLPGQSGSITFDTVGSFEVFCRINPSTMNGRVVVAPSPEPPARVRVQAFDEFREGETKRFDPPELEVRPGTELTVANVGGLPHTLTAEDGSFTTGTIEPGAEQGRFPGTSGSVVLEDEGTFAFFCEIHPDVMRGTLTVAGEAVDGGEASGRDPPDEEPAADEQPAADAADSLSVAVADFEFSPPEAAVLPSGEVTWSNGGAVAHTATFDEAAVNDVKLDTGAVDPGGAVALTAPADPGSYSYFCSIHPDQMRGVLVVAPADAGGDAPAEPDGEAAAAPSGGDGTSASALLAAGAVLLLGAIAVAAAVAGRRRVAG